ncbi:MAG: MalY/PatB family protein [Bacillus sp. (in: firmicutes)]
MSNYNFDEQINRTNTASLKWDFVEARYGAEDLLPMWVADMDFASPKEITDALVKRAQHPVYGYTGVSDSIYTSVINWMEDQYKWKLNKEDITFSAGVVSGFTTSILALSEPGDKILIQTPVYTPFFDSVRNNGRELLLNKLHYADGTMQVDFADFEAQLQSGVKLFLLCSPHNPGGKVWSKEDLIRMGKLCKKYNVIILSDEIHADLCLPGYTHYPIASLSEELAQITVTFMAPSKTFNVAGIQASLIISENKQLLKQIQTTQFNLAFHGLNLFALEVIEAAYNNGKPWLEELRRYLQAHVETVQAFVEDELPGVACMAPEASYLVWLDCRELGFTDADLKQRMIEKGKIAISPGAMYGPGGEGFIRLNIGCTTETLQEGLKRIKRALID